MKKNFWIYMAVACLGAWIAMAFACTALVKYFVVLGSVIMFFPLLGVLVACKGLGTKKTGIGWKVGLKKNWKMFLFAWLVPAVFTAIGGVLFFLVFPDKFDMNFGYLLLKMQEAGQEVQDGTIMGMPMKTYVAVMLAASVLYAPFFNMFVALGEEVGWRGFMTPALQERFGKKPGLIVANIIWGIWHAPLIVLVNYEYGTGYWGAPITGILWFCVITMAFGICETWCYEKTGSIWAPSLFHGAINAMAAGPIIFTDGTVTNMIWGPAPHGILSGIGVILLALFIFIKMGKEGTEHAEHKELDEAL